MFGEIFSQPKSKKRDVGLASSFKNDFFSSKFGSFGRTSPFMSWDWPDE